MSKTTQSPNENLKPSHLPLPKLFLLPHFRRFLRRLLRPMPSLRRMLVRLPRHFISAQMIALPVMRGRRFMRMCRQHMKFRRSCVC